MANYILHKFYIKKPRSQKVLKPVDNSLLVNEITIQRDEPESVSAPLPPPKEITPEDAAGKQKVQDAINKLQDYLTAAAQMQSLLAEKLKNRVVVINPQEDLQLKYAIARVFGVDTDKITFDMFQKCLVIRSKLAEGKATDIDKR